MYQSISPYLEYTWRLNNNMNIVFLYIDIDIYIYNIVYRSVIPILPPTCILHSPALTLRSHRLLVGSWFLVIFEFNGLLKIHDLQPGRCFMKEIDSIPWSVLISGFRTQLHGFTGSMEFSWQAMLGDGIGPCAPERCILDWMWRHDHHVEDIYNIYICIKTYQDNDEDNRDVGIYYLTIRRWS